MRYLALDIGFSRVGTAVGEYSTGLAFARETLAYSTYQEKILQIIQEENIEALVIGIPNSLSGKKSEHQEKILQEIQLIKKKFSLPVHTFDEQFTTKIAEQSLHFLGVKSKKQKGKKDTMAAAIILQGFLDWKKNTES